MKVLVTGCRGQLGCRLVELLGVAPGFEVIATDRSRLDVTRREDCLQAATQLRPQWIVNCTAYNDVERAESEPEKAFLVNDAAVGHLADAAVEVGARLLHVSTDYVFSGDFSGASPRPYTESDPPQPLSRYGASKRAGELRLAQHPAQSVVLRTSWLYGGPGKNFLHTMLRVGEEARAAGRPVLVVNDQIGTPTDAWSLAQELREVLTSDLVGIVHAASRGQASWFEFAREIFACAGIQVALEPIRMSDYPARARRPAYSVLENRRLQAAGRDVFSHWRVGLDQAWRRLGAARTGGNPIK